MRDTKDLLEAARVVDAQASANPDLGIPVDPDVAEHMGAAPEHALSEDDIEEDA